MESVVLVCVFIILYIEATVEDQIVIMKIAQCLQKCFHLCDVNNLLPNHKTKSRKCFFFCINYFNHKHDKQMRDHLSPILQKNCNITHSRTRMHKFCKNGFCQSVDTIVERRLKCNMIY